MEKLAVLSNDELHARTLTASSNEKSATLILLDHLAEVDRRRLFATMSYSSLWEYCRKELKYSESQSFERVNAMRLIVKVPEVKKELEAGNLSLSTIAKLASHVRREKCAPTDTLGLLQEVSGKSAREVDRVLAAESPAPARPDQIRVITPETTRIIIDVDHDFLALMKRVQELGGHPGSSTQEIFKTALSDFVKRREVKTTKSIPKNNAPFRGTSEVKSENDSLWNFEGTKKTKMVHASNPRSRYTPKSVKNRIRSRSGDQCEFIDPKTQRRCECKIKLEFDHIQAFAQNGENTFENLRHYCSAHNRLAAIRTYGDEKMEKYLKNWKKKFDSSSF